MRIASAGTGLSSLVAKCQREAQRRSQSASTAHLLVAMLRSDEEAASLLHDHGVHELALLAAIRVADVESTGALDRSVEASRRIATELGAPAARGIHLLMAVTRDVRSSAHKALASIGANPQSLYVAARMRLGAETPEAARPAIAARSTSAPRRDLQSGPMGRATAKRAPVDPRPRSRRTTPPPAPSAPVADASPAVAKAAGKPLGRSAPKSTDRGRADAPPTEVFELDAQSFPILAAVGRNLTAEAAAGLVDPVIGRDDEIGRILDILARRRSNNPILVGPPGVGKTAVVEGLALALARGGERVRGLEGTVLVQVRAGALVSGTSVRGALSDRIGKLREEVARSPERIVLFLDEIHGIATGGDTPDDLSHELKSALSRGELSCVGATTEAEYRRHFEKDAALSRRFSPVYIEEPSAEAATRILEGIAPHYEAHHGITYDADALGAAVELSSRYLPDRMLPDKAIGVVDLAAARVRRRGGDRVDRVAVAEVIAEQARVPVDRLLLRDADRLLRLEPLLAEKVVGHADAMARIADALRKGAAGFRSARPLGTFLLLGPTGVGKTETAKAVSEIFFPGSPITRIDMSELGEAHGVARLLGAPPGYVGHEEGGQLTEPVRRRPYQLVLLDEIEKAHIDVLLALLPLLDEGRLTDGRGRTVDFTNTIVMMTSNLGAEAATRASSSIGFGRADESAVRPSGGRAALDAARRAVPPELWNRIDEPLYFGPLSESDVARIARRMLAGLTALVREKHGIELVVEDSAIEALVRAGGYDAALGARPMRRMIGRLIEAPLAASLLDGSLAAAGRVIIRGEGAEVRFVPAANGVCAAG